MEGYKCYFGTSEKVKIRVIIRFTYLQSTTAEVSLHESPPHFARPERLTRVKVQVFVACSIFVASQVGWWLAFLSALVVASVWCCGVSMDSLK